MKSPFAIYVRPIVALALTGLIVYGFVIDKIGAEYIMGLATGVIGSYFEGNPQNSS